LKKEEIMSVQSLFVVILLLFFFMSNITAFNYNRTYDISVDIKPSQKYLAQIPSIAKSVNLRASCNTMLCSFYIFDEKEFKEYEDSKGERGRPLVSKLSIRANTIETLSIGPDKGKRTFKARYHGSLFIVIRNLGLGTTTVTGNVFYVVDIPSNVILAVVGGVLAVFGCFLSLLLCLHIVYTIRNQKKKRHEKMVFIQDPLKPNNETPKNYNTFYPQLDGYYVKSENDSPATPNTGIYGNHVQSSQALQQSQP
jgi:hypothetical protein